MINLAATALVAFALVLIVFAIVDFICSRKTLRTWREKLRVLFPAGIGAILLAVLVLIASPLPAELLGTLPFTFVPEQFLRNNLLVLSVGVGAGMFAFAIAFFARARPLVAWGAAAIIGVLVLGGLFSYVQSNANAPAQASMPEHPSFADIRVPKGFRIQIFAQDVQDPNALAFDDAGNLYYTETVDGHVVRLRDTNGDGVADENKVFASGFKNPRGLAWHDGTLYLSSRGPLDAKDNANANFIGQINTLRDTNGDGVADENTMILNGLFSLDIQHSNNGIAFGPDGKLYIAIGGPRVGQLELNGSTYSYQGKPRDDWQFAGVLQVDPDGGNPKLFARGMRNPYSLTFDASGKLYATDNGDETIPVPDGDELNLIEQGGDYGYPYFFGIPPAWSGTVAPLVRFEPHAAPTGVVVYDAKQFPKAYRGNIVTALYWHGMPGTSYRQVVRVAQQEKDGKQVWTPIVFVENLDRPTALAIGPDGALYIADMRGGKSDPDFPGVIYRLSYPPR